MDYLIDDVFSGMNVTSKGMFGGYGLYLDGRIFGMILDNDVLALKGDETTRDQFESAGGEQFVYDGHKNKGPVAMPYWTVTQDTLEDRDTIQTWTRASAELSARKK